MNRSDESAPLLTRLVASLYSRVVDQRTGSDWRIAELDGLRGIAAMLVLLAHTHQRAMPDAGLVWAPIERGGLGGVILFFALSGFLLYLPWLRAEVDKRPTPAFKVYAIRRCLRIMPAYYASVVILAVLRVIFADRDPVGVTAMLCHFVFLPTLVAPLQTVYWTLQVEEFFYWLLPVFHRVQRRVGVVTLLYITCVIAAIWAAIALLMPRDSVQRWLENTPLFLPAFALGIFTARRWRRTDGISGRTLVLLGTATYVVLSPVASSVTRTVLSLTPLTELLFAPAASAVVLGAARGGAPLLKHPVLRFVGGISFSLYLWHMVVIRVLPLPTWAASSFLARAAITTAVSVPVALLSYLCIERPFLQLRPHQASARSEQAPVS